MYTNQSSTSWSTPIPKIRPRRHATPGHPFKPMFQDRSDAHEDEEAADGAKLSSPSGPPQPEIVYQRGHAERAQQRPEAPEQCAAGPRAKDDEHVPEELVLAESPEIHDRRGQPRAVGGPRHCQAGRRRMTRPTRDAM